MLERGIRLELPQTARHRHLEFYGCRGTVGEVVELVDHQAVVSGDEEVALVGIEGNVRDLAWWCDRDLWCVVVCIVGEGVAERFGGAEDEGGGAGGDVETALIGDSEEGGGGWGKVVDTVALRVEADFFIAVESFEPEVLERSATRATSIGSGEEEESCLPRP